MFWATVNDWLVIADIYDDVSGSLLWLDPYPQIYLMYWCISPFSVPWGWPYTACTFHQLLSIKVILFSGNPIDPCCYLSHCSPAGPVPRSQSRTVTVNYLQDSEPMTPMAIKDRLVEFSMDNVVPIIHEHGAVLQSSKQNSKSLSRMGDSGWNLSMWRSARLTLSQSYKPAKGSLYLQWWKQP